MIGVMRVCSISFFTAVPYRRLAMPSVIGMVTAPVLPVVQPGLGIIDHNFVYMIEVNAAITRRQRSCIYPVAAAVIYIHPPVHIVKDIYVRNVIITYIIVTYWTPKRLCSYV